MLARRLVCAGGLVAWCLLALPSCRNGGVLATPPLDAHLTVTAAGETAPVPHDPDDPAIWVNPGDPARSLVLATDKVERDGGLYVFGLDGALRQAITPMDRPNNVDVEYGVTLGSWTGDVAVVTERKQHRLRVFGIPADGGPLRDLAPEGLPVLAGGVADAGEPMGIGLYTRPSDGALFVIVAPKTGPAEGYMAQYRVGAGAGGQLEATEVRRFGAFSHIGAEPGDPGEIEAVVVDDELGFVYYADERCCLRKYLADPDAVDAGRELARFGEGTYQLDREGLALYVQPGGRGFLVSSDQIPGGTVLHLYPREGRPGVPHDHPEIATVHTQADETDGLDVTSTPLPGFPDGLLVMMNSGPRTFLLPVGGPGRRRWENARPAGHVSAAPGGGRRGLGAAGGSRVAAPRPAGLHPLLPARGGNGWWVLCYLVNGSTRATHGSGSLPSFPPSRSSPRAGSCSSATTSGGRHSHAGGGCSTSGPSSSGPSPSPTTVITSSSPISWRRELIGLNGPLFPSTWRSPTAASRPRRRSSSATGSGRGAPRVRCSAGSLLPFAANVLNEVAKASPAAAAWLPLNPTLPGFAASATFLGWAVMRYRLLDARPVALGCCSESLPDPVIVLNESGVVVDANQSADTVLGSPGRALVGQPRTRPSGARRVGLNWWTAAMAGPSGRGRRRRPPAGSTSSRARLVDRHQRSVGTLVVLRDITARKALEARLRQDSHSDGLTGLLNRRAFDEEAARLRASREFPWPSSRSTWTD
ncbi:MAG: phytase [Vicinamibacterales bacterium]